MKAKLAALAIAVAAATFTIGYAVTAWAMDPAKACCGACTRSLGL